MADNTERLIVEADVSSLDTGAKALDSFVEKADSAGAAADDLSSKGKRLTDVFGPASVAAESAAKSTETFGDSAGRSTQYVDKMGFSLADAAKQFGGVGGAVTKSSDDLRKLLANIDPVNAKLNQLDDQLSELNKFKASGLIDETTFRDYASMIERSRQRVIPFNAEITKSAAITKAATSEQRRLNTAIGAMAPQLTDIVVGLQGGQNPFTVFLQQGGQIRDQLGMLRVSFKDVALAIGPTILTLGTAIGTIVALGAAAYQSGRQFDAMASSIIAMGGQGFKTIDEMRAAAVEVGNSVDEASSKITDMLIELQERGNLSVNAMKEIVKTAALAGQAGRDADKLTEALAKVGKDPIKGIAELNEQYGILDVKQMKNLINIEKTQGKQAAADAALKIATDELDKRFEKIIESTDNIGQAWLSVKTFAMTAFSEIGISMRALGNNIIDIGKVIKLAFQTVFADINQMLAALDLSVASGMQTMLSKIPGGQKLSDSLGLNDYVNTLKDNREVAKSEYELLLKDYQDVRGRIDRPISAYEQEARQGSGVTGTGATDRASRDAVTKLAEENKKNTKEKKVQVDYGDRLVEQYQQQATALDAQIATLKNRSAFDQNMSEQMKNFYLLQARINKLEEIQADSKGRQLTAQEKQLLAQKDAVLEAAKEVGTRGDIVKQMQRQAQISDELKKNHSDIDAQVAAIRDSWGKTADETERAVAAAQRAASLRAGGASDTQIADDAKKQDELIAAQKSKNADWVGGMKTGLAEWAEAATNYAQIAQNAVSSAMDRSADAMTEFVTTGKLDFKSFTTDILKMIVQIISKMLIMKAIQAGMSLFGGGATSTAVTANAKGGVYDSPSLSAYSNQIVNSPKLFAFAQGSTGLMGEAGPEAIMPLKRGSDGNLGVRVSGGGGVTVGVNVTVNRDGTTDSSTNSGDALGRAWGQVIADSVNAGIERALKPGGLIFMSQQAA
uniref:Tail length tape measure protein n=2 Tax=unclassified Caudoviricetes TaxID=2788787 RepID=A0AB39AC18_9CAUD